MTCCSGIPVVNGQAGSGGGGGGGGGDAALFQGTFITEDAEVVVVPLGTVPVNGSSIAVWDMQIQAIFTDPAGIAGGIYELGTAQALRNAPDGALVYMFPLFGVPPGPLPVQGISYQTPFSFGVPGAIPFQVVGSELRFTCTGLAGFDIRFSYRGHMSVFDGATRIHP